jgi:hypothetical protein
MPVLWIGYACRYEKNNKNEKQKPVRGFAAVTIKTMRRLDIGAPNQSEGENGSQVGATDFEEITRYRGFN